MVAIQFAMPDLSYTLSAVYSLSTLSSLNLLCKDVKCETVVLTDVFLPFFPTVYFNILHNAFLGPSEHKTKIIVTFLYSIQYARMKKQLEFWTIGQSIISFSKY